jgi:hypothetical protein
MLFDFRFGDELMWTAELKKAPSVYATDFHIVNGQTFNATGDISKAIRFNSFEEAEVWCNDQDVEWQVVEIKNGKL